MKDKNNYSYNIIQAYTPKNHSSYCAWIVGPSEFNMVELGDGNVEFQYYFYTAKLDVEDPAYITSMSPILRAIMSYKKHNTQTIKSAGRLMLAWKRATENV